MILLREFFERPRTCLVFNHSESHPIKSLIQFLKLILGGTVRFIALHFVIFLSSSSSHLYAYACTGTVPYGFIEK
jgi:hypothetical protein